VTPTLVGWWKLDNDVKDSSGAGNNGTIVGTPTYVAAGRIGASLKLNGTTDYIDCGNAANLNMTDVVTLSAWIKPAGLGNSAYQTFISKGDHAYVLAQTNVNQLQLAIYDGTWYSANSAAVTSTMNGSWHHVAGTYDGTQVKLYVDGKMAASTLRTGVIATDTFVLSIGRNSEASGRLFTGEMDDVRIYHGVLPTSEIVKLANP
jgi:beta-galactosidase